MKTSFEESKSSERKQKEACYRDQVDLDAGPDAKNAEAWIAVVARQELASLRAVRDKTWRN